MREPFLKLIPAAPGTRCVELWGNTVEQPELVFETVIGWAELERYPGRLFPVIHNGEGFFPVMLPERDEDDFWIEVLAPGAEANSHCIEAALRLRSEREEQERARQTAQATGRGVRDRA
jgi:hypothetical protein